MFKVSHDLLEFLKGIPDVLRGLLGLLNEAPEPYREWLVAAFWILPMVWLVLKILFSQPYMNAYQLIGKVGMALFKGMKSDLALPPPTPWVCRIFQVVAMLVGYLGSIFCLLFLVAIFILIVLSKQPGTAALLGGVGMLAVSGYFAWFCFAVGEQARLNFFKAQSCG
ncbi:MAG: hypothetical protein PHE17_14970 [Thiothrix sp.]|uniref:hypothetical protein n=1 Tax=Thiothrix sp. TaxID=1032 RepID=UPI00262CAB61|nr:hypothetical protein [Thiothrix sp.]MDD5394314.1 hypothetical protein [Thiothrix sp.]